MDTAIDFVLENLTAINWSGPALFVVIILAILLLLKKWAMFFLIVLTILLGWGAQDLIITNIESTNKVISVSFVIYCIGGGVIFLLALIAFLKSSI